MATMYDAVDAAAVPADAAIVAGYIDGNYQSYDALVARFPDAVHVSITTGSAPGARVCDCENGDDTPNQAAAWAKAELEAGRRPTIYYSRSSAASVGAALGAQGVAATDVDFWIADWTGEAHMVPGSVATQWGSPATGSGGNFDISETDGVWPGTGETPSAPTGQSGSDQPAPLEPPSAGQAPSSEGSFMPPTVQSGDVSGAVRSVQALCSLHAPIAVDGVFGPQTEEAVRNFQTIMHLTVDGIVGPQTWTALDAFG